MVMAEEIRFRGHHDHLVNLALSTGFDVVVDQQILLPDIQAKLFESRTDQKLASRGYVPMGQPVHGGGAPARAPANRSKFD